MSGRAPWLRVSVPRVHGSRPLAEPLASYHPWPTRACFQCRLCACCVYTVRESRSASRPCPTPRRTDVDCAEGRRHPARPRARTVATEPHAAAGKTAQGSDKSCACVRVLFCWDDESDSLKDELRRRHLLCVQRVPAYKSCVMLQVQNLCPLKYRPEANHRGPLPKTNNNCCGAFSNLRICVLQHRANLLRQRCLLR